MGLLNVDPSTMFFMFYTKTNLYISSPTGFPGEIGLSGRPGNPGLKGKDGDPGFDGPDGQFSIDCFFYFFIKPIFAHSSNICCPRD